MIDPPLIDWNEIQTTLVHIVEELRELTESHLSLITRVKDIEDRLPPLRI